MRITLAPLSVAALLLAGAAAAAPFTFDPARLSAHDKTLGSDAFEGRGVATPAETKTIDYQATKAGTIKFKCCDFCGLGHGKMSGTIVVK